MLLLLLACADGTVSVGEDAASVTLLGPSAVDPVLGEARYTLERTGGKAVTVEVIDASGAQVRVLADGSSWTDTVRWDGTDASGARVPRGAYTIRAALAEGGDTVATDALDVEVVRVGITSGTLGGDRIALAWHAEGGRGGYWDGGDDAVTFALASIDAADGSAAAVPEPWDDLYEPPAEGELANLPAAYAWDARPTLSLVVSGELGDAALTAAIDGWTLTDGEAAAGGTLTFTRDAPLAEGPRVVEETLTLRWLAGDGEVGTQAVPLRMYALLGPPAFEEEGLPYQPWVAVIDPALRAIEGVAPTEEAVLSGLVEHIYRDLGLSYDTRWGASSYTQYDGGGWDDAHFDLSGFLDRTRGSVVNCTDCAAILEAFANMLGAALSYTILTPDFDLNFIQSIGGDHFTQCPFDSGGCGFSYHAVTTPDDADTIYDATLALDGDGDPSAYPAEELLVQAIAGEDYLDLLVESGNPRYRYTQKETIQ